MYIYIKYKIKGVLKVTLKVRSLLALCSVCVLKNKAETCTKPWLCKQKKKPQKKVTWTEPHGSTPANQQQGAFSSQSQGKGEGSREDEGVIVISFALAMCVHEFGGGASKGALYLFSCRVQT